MNSFDLNNLNFVNLIKVYDIYISGKETRTKLFISLTTENPIKIPTKVEWIHNKDRMNIL